MRGLGTDHVISGPMRGLEKNSIRWRKQKDTNTDGHGDSMTDPAQWGRVSENLSLTFSKNKDLFPWIVEQPYILVSTVF